MIANLCQYHCVNTPGSYKCICPAGFSLERGRQCQGRSLDRFDALRRLFVTLDIDECRPGANNCRAEDACVNLRGGYRCYFVDCPEGYEKLGNKSVERHCQRSVTLMFHFSRCQLSPRWCQENQNNANLRCTINKPVKYVYTFIALPGREIALTVFTVACFRCSSTSYAVGSLSHPQ